MATKKPDIFEMSGKEPPKEKKPTLAQYIKENPNLVYPIYSRIDIIWFPGQWDNYSLECECFRISISNKHPIFEILDKQVVKLLTERDSSLLVIVEDSERTIGIRESNFYGIYKPIGNVGYKFHPTDGAN